jgi:hypothetical protein
MKKMPALPLLVFFIISCSTYSVRNKPDGNTWQLCPACNGYGSRETIKKIRYNGNKQPTDKSESLVADIAEIFVTDKINAINEKRREKTGDITDFRDQPKYNDPASVDSSMSLCISCFGNGWVYDGTVNDIDISNLDWTGNEYGTYTLPNGTIYTGQWNNYKPYGFGKMTYPDGDVYYGEFSGFNRHGHGRLIHSDYTDAEGLWRNDKLVKKN